MSCAKVVQDSILGIFIKNWSYHPKVKTFSYAVKFERIILFRAINNSNPIVDGKHSVCKLDMKTTGMSTLKAVGILVDPKTTADRNINYHC